MMANTKNLTNATNTYQAGDLTKEKIFKASQELFYKKGFEETTYDDISKAAEVNRALIVYHFSSKKNLGYVVYQKMVDDFNAVSSRIDEGLSRELRVIASMFLFYRMLENKKLTRFLVGIHRERDFRVNLIENEGKFFKEMTDKNKKLSREQIEMLIHIDYGIEKELIKVVYFQKDANIDELTKMELHMVFGYMGYSKSKINKMIEESLEHLERHTVSIGSRFTIKSKTVKLEQE